MSPLSFFQPVFWQACSNQVVFPWQPSDCKVTHGAERYKQREKGKLETFTRLPTA